MILQPNNKLLFMGDSITDYSRARPIGEAYEDGLGKGYVSLVAGMLTAYTPQYRIRVVNMGTNGDSVRHLQARWKSDALEQNPDWIAIMIGINDAWRSYDAPFIPEQAVSGEEYERIYRSLIEQSLPHIKGMVLMTPFYLSGDLHDPMKRDVTRNAGIVRKLAAEYGLVLCDVQKAFDEMQSGLHYMAYAYDGIHPNENNPVGHLIIARAFLRAIKAWPLP